MNPDSSELDGNEQWAPVSDLMAALMLIFMFIAIVFIRTVVNAETTQREECNKIYQVLMAEFEHDFKTWNVELLEDLTIQFHNPELLFESQKADIRPRFADILRDFFPRYMDIIRSEQYRDDIREIRVEGHTSSKWQGASDPNKAYLNNMELSQARTRAVLEVILGLPESAEYEEWAKTHITANGLSSSQLILKDANGGEDDDRSKRVEFRLMTTSCRKAGVYDKKKEVEST